MTIARKADKPRDIDGCAFVEHDVRVNFVADLFLVQPCQYTHEAGHAINIPPARSKKPTRGTAGCALSETSDIGAVLSNVRVKSSGDSMVLGAGALFPQRTFG